MKKLATGYTLFETVCGVIGVSVAIAAVVGMLSGLGIIGFDLLDGEMPVATIARKAAGWACISVSLGVLGTILTWISLQSNKC